MIKRFSRIIGVAALIALAAVINTPPTAQAQARIYGYGTATAVAGAATVNQTSGVVTSEALTTAALADYTLTLTNSTVETTGAVVSASVQNGTNTTVEPVVTRITPGVGSVVIIVRNLHATAPLNGTIKIAFAVQHR